MRIHCFDYNGYKRWIDLDHVQQITDLYYNAHPETVLQDKDGIDYTVKSHGSGLFRYQVAFHEAWDQIEIKYDADRYEYTKGKETNKIDAFARLEEFKAEYEKFLKAWKSAQPAPP